MAEEMKEVLLRLKCLEDKIGAISATPKAGVAKLTEAEVSAYHKVATALWEDGTCGINETSPCVFTCNVVTGGKVVPIPKTCTDYKPFNALESEAEAAAWIAAHTGPCIAYPGSSYRPMMDEGWRFRRLGR